MIEVTKESKSGAAMILAMRARPKTKRGTVESPALKLLLALPRNLLQAMARANVGDTLDPNDYVENFRQLKNNAISRRARERREQVEMKLSKRETASNYETEMKSRAGKAAERLDGALQPQFPKAKFDYSQAWMMPSPKKMARLHRLYPWFTGSNQELFVFHVRCKHNRIPPENRNPTDANYLIEEPLPPLQERDKSLKSNKKKQKKKEKEKRKRRALLKPNMSAAELLKLQRKIRRTRMRLDLVLNEITVRLKALTPETQPQPPATPDL